MRRRARGRSGPARVQDPIARNHGETLGVFLPMDFRSKTPQDGLFQSGAMLANLNKIEHLLDRLAPPKWPEDVLGKIDRQKASQGKALFTTHCASCHNSYPYTWTAPNKYGKRFIEVGLVPQTYVGTDPAQFERTQAYAITGHLSAYLPPPYKDQAIIPTASLQNGARAVDAAQGARAAEAHRRASCSTTTAIASFRDRRRRWIRGRRRHATAYGPPDRSCTTARCPTCTRC